MAADEHTPAVTFVHGASSRARVLQQVLFGVLRRLPADEAVLKGAGQRAVDVAARGRADRRRAGQAVDSELVRRRWRRSLDPPRMAAAPPRGWNAIHLYEAARWHGTLARRSRSRGPAGYGTARKQEIRVRTGVTSISSSAPSSWRPTRTGASPAASSHVVPLVKPLAKRLREQWIAQGRPTTGKVCPPHSCGPSRDARPRLHPRARTPRVSPARHGANQPPQVPPIPRRPGSTSPRLAEGRLEADGPQDA